MSDYLETESQVLEKQREKHASLQQTIAAQRLIERKVRGAADLPPSQPTVQEEEEEEEEGPQDEEEGAQAGASEMEGKASEPTQWAVPEMEVGRGQRRAHKRPSIVGMRMREPKEDIVDLDSHVNRYYKAGDLQLDAASRVKQRTLQREKEQEPRPVVGLGMELDAGLGMIGLQLMDEDLKLDVEQRRQKRELTGQSEFIQKGGWISLLSVGFSKLDVGLCVFLYFLSSMCLLAMYLFFKKRFRLQRAKFALP